VLLVCGVGVVRKDGLPASRIRVFWRSLLTWAAPIIAAAVGIRLMNPVAQPAGTTFLLVLLASAGLTIWSTLLPDRGIPDWMPIHGWCPDNPGERKTITTSTIVSFLMLAILSVYIVSLNLTHPVKSIIRAIWLLVLVKDSCYKLPFFAFTLAFLSLGQGRPQAERMSSFATSYQVR